MSNHGSTRFGVEVVNLLISRSAAADSTAAKFFRSADVAAPYNYKFGWAQPCKQRDASRDPMLLGCTQLEATSPGDRVTCGACREANPGIEGCSPPPGSVVVNGKTYLDQRSADQEVRFMVEQRARDLHAPACYMCCALWRYSDGPPREVRDTRGFWVCHSCSRSAASQARPM